MIKCFFLYAFKLLSFLLVYYRKARNMDPRIDTMMINESDIFQTSYRLGYDWIIRKVIKNQA